MMAPVETRQSLNAPALVWESPRLDRVPRELTQVGPSTDGGPGGESLVFLVEKAAVGANPFPAGVTVGRAPTSDLVIEHSTVSRFHAWIEHDARTDLWMVTDAESRNGTWLNGLALGPRQCRALCDSDVLRLGDAVLRFLLPDSLVAYVRDRAA